MSQLEHPETAVVVLVIKDGKTLLGRRLSTPGYGKWASPGGKQQMWERPEECAIREVAEETGQKIFNIRPVTFIDTQYPDDGKHFVTLFVEADTDDEPELLEPSKCESWNWYSWDEMPTPHLDGLRKLLASGYRPQGL
jgi:8-oxo-dGTP diphosphatase